MRWLFLLLLLANIAYVAWELNREHPQDVVSPALPAGVERIVLLSELETDTGQKPAASSHAATQVAQDGAAKPTSGDASETQQVLAESSRLTSETKATDSGETGVEDTKAVASKRLATSVDAAETAPAADLCYTLGPFSEMQTLRRVTRAIKDYVVEASFRSKEEQEQTMFRVFVRPVGSKQEAKALIKELVSKNIRDYFIITDGPNKNGISLGYFSSKDRAYRHADRVRKLGFDATAEPVFRSYTIYWLDYRIKSDSELPRQVIDDQLENSAQRLSRDCG
ncbi:MAG: SPOR domain-containing protein [Gammaproteobacteria bacterium]|nr:SPOR domain-containing protein [Gammaproteobacteria bacterium]